MKLSLSNIDINIISNIMRQYNWKWFNGDNTPEGIKYELDHFVDTHMTTIEGFDTFKHHLIYHSQQDQVVYILYYCLITISLNFYLWKMIITVYMKTIILVLMIY